MRKALTLVAILLISVGAAACEKHDAKEPVATNLASHRATYELSLLRADNRAQVNSVAGKFVVEWQDTCDGYTTNQRFLTRFGNVGGGTVLSDLSVSSWESESGDRFRFNVVNSVNGRLEDHSQGEGKRDLKTGAISVAFDDPAGETLDLPNGTVFPTEHMALLIEAAAGGNRMFLRDLFDGSYEDGLSRVSAFIGKAIAAPAEADAKALADLKADEKSRKLVDLPAWPIRMAFFSLAKDDADKDPEEGDLPDYEFALNLRANGVATDLEFDYGDFVVGGKLVEIEALPGCPTGTAPTN